MNETCVQGRACAASPESWTSWSCIRQGGKWRRRNLSAGPRRALARRRVARAFFGRAPAKRNFSREKRSR
eukprot:3031482-Pleurochrysis_carterae.AAC.1